MTPAGRIERRGGNVIDLSPYILNKKTMKKEIIKKLCKGGHSLERSQKIYNEAINSSNPDYILHYYGIKKYYFTN